VLLQVGLRAEDLDRARRCWETLLQRPALATFDPPGLLFFDLDGVRLLLDRGLPPGTVYLRVDDVDAAVERAREAGAVLESPPHAIFRHEDDTLGPVGTTEWHAFVRDPDGNLVGLVEQRLA
jgi:methylmalonyl-CoA/ethylmalonyl-CoA epimerase